MYSFREMKVQDYKMVFDLWSKTEGMGLSDADSEESIAFFLDRNAGHSFVCMHGDEIIGTILCRHDGRRGFLYHVAVSEEYRTGGVGSRLVDMALYTLRTAGIRKCHLMVYRENETGNRYWERAGWLKREDVLIYSKGS